MLQLKLREKADAERHCTNRFNLENNRGAKSILRKHLLPDGANGASCTTCQTDRRFVCEQRRALIVGRTATVIAGKFKHNLNFACS